MGTSFSFAWGDILCNLKHPFSWLVLFQDFDSFSYVISTYTSPQSNPTPSESELALFPYGGNPVSSDTVHLPTMNQLLSPGKGFPTDRFPPQQWYAVASRPQQSSCIKNAFDNAAASRPQQCSCCFVIATAVVAAVQTDAKDTAGKSVAAFLNLNLKSYRSAHTNCFFTEPLPTVALNHNTIINSTSDHNL